MEVCSAALSDDPLQWSLSSFVGTNDDAEEHALCQLRLLQGDNDGLLFGFKHEIDLVRFERVLRTAARSARTATSAQADVDCNAEAADASCVRSGSAWLPERRLLLTQARGRSKHEAMRFGG